MCFLFFCSLGPCKWRDSSLPTEILRDYCRRQGLQSPIYCSDIEARVNDKTYTLNEFEKCNYSHPFWGPPKERLACYILNQLPLVKEHIETRELRTPLHPSIVQVLCVPSCSPCMYCLARGDNI